MHPKKKPTVKTDRTLSARQSHPSLVKRQLLDFKPIQTSWLEEYPIVQQEVEKIIKKEKEDILKYAEELLREFPNSVLLPYKLHIKELKLFRHNNQNTVVSVRMTVYSYTGGAHGSTKYYSWNWDKQKNRFITLSEVITPKQFQSLIKQARHILFEKQKQNDEYDKYRSKEIQRGTSHEEDFKIWNFSKDGIMTTFPEYQVASYAAGSFEVFVSLKSL